MKYAIQDTLAWTSHYVEQGYVVIRNAVGRPFIDQALAAIRRAIGNDLPFDQWTTANAPARLPVPADTVAELPGVYDQPAVRTMLEVMFGRDEPWGGQRKFHVFISPYDEKARPKLERTGHIDFVEKTIPLLGSGFLFQVALAKTEPFSGNITIYPGTHKAVIRELERQPELRYPSNPFFERTFTVEPYEFVADPGDMILVHHLVGHAGNANHAAHRSPRVALHCQALRASWLKYLDPAAPNLTPWQRSLAFTQRPIDAASEEARVCA